MPTTIDRVPIEIDEQLLMNSELVEESAQVLGYSPDHIPLHGALAKALKACEIDPLNINQVIRYKDKQEYRSLTNKHKAKIVNAAVAFAALCYVWVWSGMHSLGLGFSTVGITTAFIIAVGVINDLDSKHIVRAWERTDIRNYRGKVPGQVLAKAIQLKKVLPAVSVQVEYLEQHTIVKTSAKWKQYLDDPFLVARCGTEVFYIDVWDESEFENQLLAAS